MIPTLVVLAGGVSSRMRMPSAERLPSPLAEAAHTKPKAMLPVGRNGRPFLDYLLLNIQRAGYRHVVIVVGEHDQSIERYYRAEGGTQHVPGLRLSFVPQRVPHGRVTPLGTADALLQAFRAFPEWRSESVTVCNSDNLYLPASLRLVLEDNHVHAVIAYDRAALRFSDERIARFSALVCDKDGFLTDIIEKPTTQELERARRTNGGISVSMNLWRFTYDHLLPYLEAVSLHPSRHEKELPTAVRMLVTDHPQAVHAIRVAEHVLDLTSQDDISVVQQFVRKEYPEL